MNDLSFVWGALLGALGAILVALIRFYPESARRERRRVRFLTFEARVAGLRGRYKFEYDRSRSGVTEGRGTYEPVDEGDRVLFASVGSKLEGEAAFFAREMLWTDRRFAWVGIPLLLVGIAVCAVSVFG